MHSLKSFGLSDVRPAIRQIVFFLNLSSERILEVQRISWSSSDDINFWKESGGLEQRSLLSKKGSTTAETFTMTICCFPL